MNKIIVDTNVIVRYLINDQPELHKKARGFLDLVKLGKFKAYIEQTVFTEVIFVLTKLYNIPRDKIKESLHNLLLYRGFHNNEKDILIESLNIYVQTNLHIVDCIIAAKARFEGLEIESFDKELLKYSNATIESNN
jgi:predicted nucleic-acid-binding protein